MLLTSGNSKQVALAKTPRDKRESVPAKKAKFYEHTELIANEL
jgi:hypothetical protein